MPFNQDRTGSIVPRAEVTQLQAPHPAGSSFDSNATLADSDFFSDPVAVESAYADAGGSLTSTPCPARARPPQEHASPLAQSSYTSSFPSQEDTTQFQAELRAKIAYLRGENTKLRLVANRQADAVDQLEKVSVRQQMIYERLFIQGAQKPTAAIMTQKGIMAKAHAEWKQAMGRLQGEREELKGMRNGLVGELEKRGISTDATVLGWMAADVKRAKEEEVQRQAVELLKAMKREKELLQIELADWEVNNRLKQEQIAQLHRPRRGSQ